MTFDDYEASAARTASSTLSDGEKLADAAAGLAEEAGEVLGLVRKHVYQSRLLEKERVQEELGDALWCLAMTARFAGISLEQVANANIAKLKKRHHV